MTKKQNMIPLKDLNLTNRFLFDEVTGNMCILLKHAVKKFQNVHYSKETESPRIQRIHDRVCKVKMNEEVGVRYMQAWEEKYYAKEDGRKEMLIDLIEKKLQKGKLISTIAAELEMDAETVIRLIQEMNELKKE